MRDYLQEAFQIAGGRTLLLPEKAHIVVLIEALRQAENARDAAELGEEL